MQCVKVEHNRKQKKKERALTLALIGALIIILILLFQQCSQPEYVPGMTAVIEENPAEELNDSASGSIRIKLSPTVTVKNGVMQDLNFCNYNEGRLMSCKIMVGGQCAYESGFLEEGKILTGDFIDTELLQTGEQEALAEIYSFDLEKKPIGQTNVKIKLVVE